MLNISRRLSLEAFALYLDLAFSSKTSALYSSTSWLCSDLGYIKLIPRTNLAVPLQPRNTMSDWQRGSRNAFRHVYSGTRLYGCWFHYTQAIWKHIQKYGLASSYRDITELKSFVRQIMTLPFLPGDLIHSTHSFLQIPTLPQIEKLKLDAFLKYFKRYWLTKVKPNELSIFELENGTNNGAESYHARLKSLFKSSHPQIWKFMDTFNDTIADYDNEIARLEQGKDITRSRKVHVRVNMEYRKAHGWNLYSMGIFGLPKSIIDKNNFIG